MPKLKHSRKELEKIVSVIHLPVSEAIYEIQTCDEPFEISARTFCRIKKLYQDMKNGLVTSDTTTSKRYFTMLETIGVNTQHEQSTGR